MIFNQTFPYALNGPIWLVGAVLALTATVAFHFVMEPWRWAKFYLKNEASVVSARVYAAFFSTALASYVVPLKLGVPIRLLILRQTTGASTSFIGLTLALDAGLSMLVWCGFAIVIALALSLSWHLPLPVYWLLPVTAGMFVTVLFATKRGQSIRGKIGEGLSQMNFTPRRIIVLIIIICCDVMSYGARHACLAILVGAHWAVANLAASIGIFATFVGMVSGLPLGLVGYDATLIVLLSAAGLSAADAAMIAVFNRMTNIAMAAALGIPAGISLGFGTGPASVFKRLWKLANGKT